MPDVASIELHDRETAFHDRWARSVDPESVNVRAAFEAPTAIENQYILSRMKQLDGRRVLDIGAGLGESSVYFALNGFEVTCTDLSPEMVALAERIAWHHDVRIDGIVCPAESIDAADESFDFVYAANVLHHVQDRAAMLREVHRVLTPGGWFFSWDPLAYNPVINVYRRMACAVRTEDEMPLTFADLQTVRHCFSNVGHREFWIASLGLFLKYYLIDRVHPNNDRYWKRIYAETSKSLWWWFPLRSVDAVLTRMPLIRRLAWNTVISAQKAPGAGHAPRT